jgi:tetratricopeptide (TPR) repeat protein
MPKKLFLLILVPGILFSCFPKTAKQYVKLAVKKMNHHKSGYKIDTLLTRAITLDSTYHLAYMYMAENASSEGLSRKEYFEKQRFYYLKALKYDSLNPMYLSYYAQTYRFECKIKSSNDTIYYDASPAYKAIKIYSKAINIDPTIGSIYYGRAYCLNVIGDSLAYWKDIHKAAELGDRLAINILKDSKK